MALQHARTCTARLSRPARLAFGAAAVCLAAALGGAGISAANAANGANAAGTAQPQAETVTISSAQDLATLATRVNAGTLASDATVVLAGDIDLSSIASWTPIGNSADKPFTASFDGKGHSISGLAVSSTTGGAGLFGWNKGAIENFTLSGTVTDSSSVKFAGGVVAYNAATVSNVHSSVAVNAGGVYFVGGIAGYNDGGAYYDGDTKTTTQTGGQGKVVNCSTTGSVTGCNKVGGIAGENAGAISACFSTSTVDGTNTSSKNGVGGIAGRNGNNDTASTTGTIESCYFKGTVGRSGQKWVGGIAGFNNALSSVKNCYMAGTLVKGEKMYNAVIGGDEHSKGTGVVQNNYALSTISGSGTTESEAGISKSADELKAAAGLLGSAYAADTGSINQGYPVLLWQQTVAVTGVSVAPASASLSVGGTVDLTATVAPANATDKGLSWKSGDAAVATVVPANDGVSAQVTGVAPGTATITVTTDDGAFTATCDITVTAALIDISGGSIAAIGDQVETGSAITPELVVSAADGTKLSAGTDYEAVYTNNVEPGTAHVVVTGTGAYTGTLEADFTITAKPAPGPTPSASLWERLAGATAFGTMKAIVNEGWDTSEYAILATSKGYQDALASVGLAGMLECPVLITDPSALSGTTKAVLGAKQVKKVIIVGGEQAVSAAVAKQVAALGISVKRVAGATAAGTARAIYKYGKDISGDWGSDAIVATCDSYQDALSIAPYAYAKKAPIFLTSAGKKELSDNIYDMVKNAEFKRTIIVGGTAAVKGTMDSKLDNPVRLAGNTAYGTSKKVAEFCLKEGMSVAHMGVATGRSYYDALSGAALCGKMNSVIILADDGHLDNISGVVGKNKAQLQENCYVFGGPNAVSDTVYKAIEAASK